jgi:hypothetical protein
VPALLLSDLRAQFGHLDPHIDWALHADIGGEARLELLEDLLQLQESLDAEEVVMTDTPIELGQRGYAWLHAQGAELQSGPASKHCFGCILFMKASIPVSALIEGNSYFSKADDEHVIYAPLYRCVELEELKKSAVWPTTPILEIYRKALAGYLERGTLALA